MTDLEKFLATLTETADKDALEKLEQACNTIHVRLGREKHEAELAEARKFLGRYFKVECFTGEEARWKYAYVRELNLTYAGLNATVIDNTVEDWFRIETEYGWEIQDKYGRDNSTWVEIEKAEFDAAYKKMLVEAAALCERPVREISGP